MKEGEIYIETLQSGEIKTRSRSGCRCYIKNGIYHVLFTIDNDKCRISFDEEGMTYRRQGEMEYELLMSDGMESRSRINTVYGATEIHCLTHYYNMSASTDEIMLNIKYNMAEEDNEMKIIIKELR